MWPDQLALMVPARAPLVAAKLAGCTCASGVVGQASFYPGARAGPWPHPVPTGRCTGAQRCAVRRDHDEVPAPARSRAGGFTFRLVVLRVGVVRARP